MLLANLLRQGKNYNDAEEMLKYALMLDVSAENTLVSLGMLYLDKGEYDDARYCFNRAFSVSGGGGPANQGMMLISFAEMQNTYTLGCRTGSISKKSLFRNILLLIKVLDSALNLHMLIGFRVLMEIIFITLSSQRIAFWG